MKRKRNRRAPEQHPVSPQNKPSILWRAWAIFLATAAIAGFVQTVFAFLPNISVSASTPLDKNSSSYLRTTPFIVSNDGILSIYSLEYSCFIRFAEFTHGGRMKDSLFRDANFDKKILRPNEKDNLPCLPPHMIKGPPFAELIDADIEVRISFRPSFILWRQEKYFRFATYKTNTSELQWLPKPID